MLNAAFQASSKLAATLLVEFQASHIYGDRAFLFVNEERTHVKLGVQLYITPEINFNPYLHVIPAHLNLSTTSLGFMFYWKVLYRTAAESAYSQRSKSKRSDQA